MPYVLLSRIYFYNVWNFLETKAGISSTDLNSSCWFFLVKLEIFLPELNKTIPVDCTLSLDPSLENRRRLVTYMEHHNNYWGCTRQTWSAKNITSIFIRYLPYSERPLPWAGKDKSEWGRDGKGQEDPKIWYLIFETCLGCGSSERGPALFPHSNHSRLALHSKDELGLASAESDPFGVDGRTVPASSEWANVSMDSPTQ